MAEDLVARFKRSTTWKTGRYKRDGGGLIPIAPDDTDTCGIVTINDVLDFLQAVESELGTTVVLSCKTYAPKEDTNNHCVEGVYKVVDADVDKALDAANYLLACAMHTHSDHSAHMWRREIESTLANILKVLTAQRR
jgi:hypothetical protein